MNPGPLAHETSALPLSYTAICFTVLARGFQDPLPRADLPLSYTANQQERGFDSVPIKQKRRVFKYVALNDLVRGAGPS